MYSMPPDHGAEVVQLILNSPALRDDWSAELAEMRNRINGLRIQLVEQIKASDIDGDYSFIQEEKGMFSFLGIDVPQVQKLVKEHSVYLVDSSRINVAGISNANIGHFVKSLRDVTS
jgi:aspartate aminotransferase